MIGKHTKIITISGRGTNVADGYGGVVEVFTTKWTGFAGVEKVSGSKGIEASAVSLGSVYKFTLRKNPQINFAKTDKIVYDSQTFGINSIDKDKDRFLVITASVSE